MDMLSMASSLPGGIPGAASLPGGIPGAAALPGGIPGMPSPSAPPLPGATNPASPNKPSEEACVAKDLKDLFNSLYGKTKYFAFRMPLNFKKDFKTSNRICYNSAGIARDKPHHEISDIQRSWWLVEKTDVPEEYKILYSYTPCNYYHTVDYKSSYFKPPWMTVSDGVSYNDSEDPEHLKLDTKPKPGSKSTEPPKIKIPWTIALHCLQPMKDDIIETFKHKSSAFAGGSKRKSKRRHFNPRRTKTYKRNNIKK
jgi:hypothetical protein